MPKQIIRLTVGLLFIGSVLLPAAPLAALPGERILYGDSNGEALVSINPDGTDRRVIGTGYEPKVSPDGRKIATLSPKVSSGVDVFVMNADGTNIHNVSNADEFYTAGPDPDWSPDSSRLAYEKAITDNGTSIFIVNADGTNDTLLMPAVSIANAYFPKWSPDGQKILFTAVDGDFEDEGIYIMDADGSNAQMLIDNAAYGSWSPDGTKIVFEADFYTNNGKEIAVMDADGSNVVRLSTTIGPDLSPDWSPDGSRIAWSAPEGLRTVRPDGTDVTTVVSRINSASPSVSKTIWSPDGTHLLYTFESNPGQGLHTIAHNGTGDQLVTTESVFSPTWAFIDDTPSGDTTPPAVGTLEWSHSPKAIAQTSLLSAPVTDNLPGTLTGEYFVGDTDPGYGNGTALPWNGTALSTTFGTHLQPGVYKVTVRAQDAAGNWSDNVSDYLVVYDPAGPGTTGKKMIIPSLANGDSLPGLIAANQSDTATFAFSASYDHNGVIANKSDLKFDYTTGTKCNKPAEAINCHTFTINTNTISWLVVDGANQSTATFQGVATLAVDGAVSANPFKAIAIDGDRRSPTDSDHFTLLVYAPGANPATATPIYQVAQYIGQGDITIR